MPFWPFFISLPMRESRRLLLILLVTLALMDLGFFLPGTRLPRVAAILFGVVVELCVWCGCGVGGWGWEATPSSHRIDEQLIGWPGRGQGAGFWKATKTPRRGED